MSALHLATQRCQTLTFTTHWADSADDKLVIFFLFFPEKRILHFSGDNLHEMSNLDS